MTDECSICAKHLGRGPLVGPVVWEDEHVVVSHRPVDDRGTTVLGYVFVETRRHVAAWDMLTEVEASATAKAAWWAARALRAELSAEYVFSAIVGRAVAHFHQHVFARHPGTPQEFGWTDGDEWPDAPRGDSAALTDLCARLRPHFGSTG